MRTQGRMRACCGAIFMHDGAERIVVKWVPKGRLWREMATGVARKKRLRPVELYCVIEAAMTAVVPPGAHENRHKNAPESSGFLTNFSP